MLRGVRRVLAQTSPAEKVFYGMAYIVLTAWALISLFPMYWMFITALKTNVSVMKLPPEWIPSRVTLAAFRKVFHDYPMSRWLRNTAVVAVSATVLQLAISAMGGYGFAKKRFPGRELIFWMYISSMMVPIFAVLIPLYQLMARWKLIDTYLGLIVPALSAPFGVFLMRQFISTLPDELIDAAKIDGCSEVGVFSRIILPLSLPGLAVLGIFVFMGQWGAFFWPMIITNSTLMRTAVVGLAALGRTESRTDYAVTMAGSTILALPMMVVFVVFQRYFLQGITLGALKG